MVTVSAMVMTLFFGGWDIPFTHWDETPGIAQTLVTGVVMFLKTLFFVFLFMWIRWTLPRFRYDQLMALGWKVLMPIGLAYVMVTATAIYVVQDLFGLPSSLALYGALGGLNLVLGYLVFIVLDRGLLISGSRNRRAAAGGLDRAA